MKQGKNRSFSQLSEDVKNKSLKTSKTSMIYAKRKNVGEWENKNEVICLINARFYQHRKHRCKTEPKSPPLFFFGNG
jgi:hypothetical protein